MRSPGGVFGGLGMWPPDAGDGGTLPLAGERPPGEGEGEGEGEGDAEAEEGDADRCDRWMGCAPPLDSPAAAAPACAASASFPFLVSTCTTSDFGLEKLL